MSDFDYKPQKTDLKKFGTNYGNAFKKGENKLLDPCTKCNTRHWSHQSCKKPS